MLTFHCIVCDSSGGRVAIDVEIRVKDKTLDSALRRFKRQCAKAGVLAEVRKRTLQKPSVRRKKKSEAARKKV